MLEKGRSGHHPVGREPDGGWRRRWRRAAAFGAAVAAAAALGVAGAQGASAAVSPTQQWQTTTGVSAPTDGASMGLGFGTTGVVASVLRSRSVGAVSAPTALAGADFAGTNVGAFLEPDAPAGASTVGQALVRNAPTDSPSLREVVTFSKPVLSPILHIIGLDASFVDVTGVTTAGTPTTMAALASNNALEITGNRLNATTVGGQNDGCQANDGTNPAGGCGSFQFGGGTVRSLTLDNGVGAGSSTGDGWDYALSFPTVPLTKAFSPAAIPSGGTSQLTFTLSNPDTVGQTAMSPLDFTDALPAGLRLADATVADNGECGAPALTDAGGDPVAAGATSVTASNVALAVGATCTITVDVTTTSPGSYLSNDSTVSSTVGNVVPDTRAALTVTPAADLAIAKMASSSPAVPGTPISYQLLVRNNGPNAAVNASATDALPAGLAFASASPGCTASGQTVECAAGDLAPGASATFTVTASVAADLAAGDLSNTATTTSDTPDTNPGNNSSTAAVPVEPEADLAIVKRALSSRPVPGKQLDYELTVTSAGPSVARDVTVSDPLPRGLSFVSASNGCRFAGGQVTCTAASLAVNGSVTFKVTTMVASSLTGGIANTATVSSAATDPNTDNNTATSDLAPGPEADLSITKIPSADSVGVGGQLFYTLLVRNSGPSDAQDVVITDRADSALTLRSATASQGPACSVSGDTATCRVGALAAGGTAQVLVSARVDQAGQLSDSATAKSPTHDPNESDNTATATITGSPLPPAQPADLAIVKTANHRSVLGAGTITYTLKVTNHGPGAAPGVQVIDTPSLPIKVRSVRASAGRCTTTAPIRCELGTMSAGASATITVVAQPTAPGTLRNSASVTGDVPDPNGGNIDTTTTTVRGLLKISEAASATTVRAGGTLSYRITATNASGFALRPVRVCDNLPPGLVKASTAPKARLSKGQYCWTLKTLGAHKSQRFTVKARVLSGAGGGRKVNVATATAPGARSARSSGGANGAGTIRVLAARHTGRAGGVTG